MPMNYRDRGVAHILTPHFPAAAAAIAMPPSLSLSLYMTIATMM
jgi:hypothetical protein